MIARTTITSTSVNPCSPERREPSRVTVSEATTNGANCTLTMGLRRSSKSRFMMTYPSFYKCQSFPAPDNISPPEPGEFVNSEAVESSAQWMTTGRYTARFASTTARSIRKCLAHNLDRHRHAASATSNSRIVSSQQSPSDQGFTVLEVVVALAIFTLSLTVLFSVITESLRNTANAEALSRAGMIAQSILSQVGNEIPVREANMTGETTDGFHWRLRMKAYAPVETEQISIGIYHVVAEVQGSGLKTQSVILNTLRFGPKEVRR